MLRIVLKIALLPIALVLTAASAANQPIVADGETAVKLLCHLDGLDLINPPTSRLHPKECISLYEAQDAGPIWLVHIKPEYQQKGLNFSVEKSTGTIRPLSIEE
jgi:hypothetical protein